MFASGAGISALVTLSFLNSGLPLGLPPAAADPHMARVAPEECIAYLSWSGSSTADANSTNELEKLLAEPEIQFFVKEVEARLAKAFDEMAEDEPDAAIAMKWVQRLLSRPAAAFVSKVDITPAGPDVEGGMVAHIGDDAAELTRLWDRLRADAPPDAVKEVKVGGVTMYQVTIEEEVPKITVGIKGKYLYVGIGDGAVEGMLKRAETDPPNWLTTLHKQLPVDRPSIITYINGAAIIEKVNRLLLGGPEGDAILKAIGVGNITSLSSVSGLDKTGYVTEAIIGLDGEPTGVLASAIGKPLTPQDLEPIPADSTLAVAARLDVLKVFDKVLAELEKVNPSQVEEIREMIGEIEEELGFRIRDDALGLLGNVLCIYHSPGEGGLLGGTAVVIPVTDKARFMRVHDKLSGMARAADGIGRGFGRGPRLKQMKLAGQEINYYTPLDDDMPISPSWCLTDEYLVLSLFPQAIKAFVTRGDDYKSLATIPEVAQAFQSGNAPIKVVYQDTPKLFELAYPLVQIVGQFATIKMRREGIDVDISILPSGESIMKHLRADVTTVAKSDDGLRITCRQSAPGTNGALLVPALALIGIGSGEVDLDDLIEGIASGLSPSKAKEVQAMNNLKQIGLAMHNYHDTYRKFPAAYSTDDDGKPLLSWRVHILPFLEQAPLYDRFHLDEPWDSEHNKTLIPLMPRVYASPGSKQMPGTTSYLTPRGENTIFPGAEGQRMATIRDGTSNTILTVEASDESAVIWTKPDDLELDPMKPTKGLVGLRKGGFLVGLADGSVFKLTERIDAESLKVLLNKDDGIPIDVDQFNANRARRRRAVDIEAVPAVEEASDAIERAVPEPR